MAFLCLLLVATSLAFVEAQNLPKSVNCVSEGRFKHPGDCGSFIDCIPDRSGGLEAREGSCRGRAFHPLLKKCVALEKVKGCNPRTARALLSNHNFDPFCEEKPNEFVCSDCKTVINCINGTAYPETCDSSNFCLDSRKYGGGVCYPNKPAECLCKTPNAFQGDKYDRHSFFFCESLTKDSIMYKCPDRMSFDAESGQCQNEDGLPPCTSTGVFADPKNCSTYYTCIMTTEGWIHKKGSCKTFDTPFFMYNEVNNSCEDPCLWGENEFKCTAEGRFSDPSNCNNYYECIADPTSEGKFIQRIRQCPIGHDWNRNIRGIGGFCIHKDYSRCAPIRTNKCEVPRAFCKTNLPQVEERPTPAETEEGVVTSENLPSEDNEEVEEGDVAEKPLIEDNKVLEEEVDEDQLEAATLIPVNVLPALIEN